MTEGSEEKVKTQGMTEHLPDAMIEAGAKAYLASKKNADIPGTFTAIYRAMRPLDPEVQALVEAAAELIPWVAEWAEMSDYPPGKAKMRLALERANAALARFTDSKDADASA